MGKYDHKWENMMIKHQIWGYSIVVQTAKKPMKQLDGPHLRSVYH